MFRHHLKLSVRNLSRQWLISGINILGLGFGMACTIIIYLFIQNELGYDRYHKNADRIYRMLDKYSVRDEGIEYSPFFPDEMSEGLKQDIPAIEYATSFRRTQVWVSYDNRKYRLNLGFVNPDFLRMFSLFPIAGDLENALVKPQGIILCRTEADHIFSSLAGRYGEMIGQVLTLPEEPPNQYMVTAIIEDIPEQSSMQYTALTHFINCQVYPRSNDVFGANSLYYQLREGADPEETIAEIRTLIDKYLGKTLSQVTEYYSLKEGDYTFTWVAQPLKKVYLGSTMVPYSYEKRGNPQVIYFLALIAGFILFIACFNYIMLTIGHSMERMKEMAVMKIVGAQRGNIIRLFWSESSLMVLLALFLGIVLAEQLLPLFNRLSEKSISFTLYQDWSSYAFLFLVMLLIVFTTSSYIATFLFRHNKPLAILRQETSLGRRYGFARLFIILQYFISVGLLVCTMVIIKQLHLLRNQDVGFNRENLVVLDVDFPLSRIQTLKNKLLESPAIEGVTMSDRKFVSGSSGSQLKNKQGELIYTRILRIDEDYVKTLGLEIVQGSNIRKSLPEDTVPVVLVNQTLVRSFGLEEPVGDQIYFSPTQKYVRIAGVVKDFHFDSMKEPLVPLIMESFPYNSIWAVFVRINPMNRQEALEHIRSSWEEVVPEFPYDYSFLDDILNSQYVNEDRWAKVTGLSSLIALFLTALGLLGLTGLLVSRRIKEIGIRKVNGARIGQILLLLNTDFQKWVLAAILIAIPASWYLMHRWLQNFENRIDLSWIYFAAAGLVAMAIALLTVTLRSYGYARKNPVDTLRYE